LFIVLLILVSAASLCTAESVPGTPRPYRSAVLELLARYALGFEVSLAGPVTLSEGWMKHIAHLAECTQLEALRLYIVAL
jgi:hypothetical protein